MKTTKELELKEIIEIMIDKWWLILLLTVFGFGTSYLLTIKLVTPIYEAKTILFIGQEDSSLGSIGISLGQMQVDSRLIIDYKEIALTRLVAEEVIKNTGLDLSYNEFQSNVIIENIGDSRLFTVGFMNADPNTAKIVADELSKQLTLAALEIVGVQNIRILDQATIPQSPVSPRKVLNAIYGGGGGFVISLLIIFILFILNDTVKNEEEIEYLIGVTVLGNIPKYKREK